MKDVSILMKNADALRSRLIRSATWGAGAFFLVLAAIASAFLFDSAASSKDGVALSMLAASIFFVSLVVFSGRTLYFFLRYRFALRANRTAQREKEDSPSKFREKTEALSRFVERHDSAVAKSIVSVFSCVTLWFLLPSSTWDFSEKAGVWCFLAILAVGSVCATDFRLSNFPFMETECLKSRPLARCAVLLAELAVVAVVFSFITVFSLFFVVLVFVLMGAVVIGIVIGIKNLL